MIRIFPDMRYEYDEAYRQIRLFGEELFHDDPHFPETTAEECALESRDYHTSEFSGWINHQRQHKFHMIKWHPELREQLPF